MFVVKTIPFTTKLLKNSALFSVAMLAMVVQQNAVGAESYPWQSPHWYLGASAGESRLSLDTVYLEQDMAAQGMSIGEIYRNTNDTGFKVFAGYQLSPMMALEGGLFRLGEVDFSASTLSADNVPMLVSGRLRAKGANLDLVASMPLGAAWSLLGRIGLTYNDTDAPLSYQSPVSLDQYQQSTHYLKHKFGAGLAYQMNPDWALRLELERYRLDDMWGDQGDMKLLSLGVVYQYGNSYRAAAPTPAYQPEQNNQAEVPVAAPATQAEAPAATAVLVELADVHFKFDQSSLTDEAKAVLDRHIVVLKANPNTQVRIAGYTSASGSEGYNQQLSEQRAAAVRNYLTEQGGLSAARLTTVGYGEASPAEFESTPTELRSTAAKANMRVLFEVLLK